MKKIVLFLLVCGVGIQFSSCSKKQAELDPAAQLAKDILDIDAYLASHSITNVVKDPSGVRWVMTLQGSGLKPLVTQNITAKYSASALGSSAPFDSSPGSTFLLSGLITGWQVALPQIPKGSIFTLYIPSGLAYGSAGISGVPGNTNVVFDIQLFDDDAQLTYDVAKIDTYLDSIQADGIHADPTGIRFIYTGTPGTGDKPISTSLVDVTYTGKFLSNKKVFTTQTSQVTVAISDVIPGWRIGLQLVPAGSQITLYIPSGLAYGPAGSSNGAIPGNANLIFEIHVIGIH